MIAIFEPNDCRHAMAICIISFCYFIVFLLALIWVKLRKSVESRLYLVFLNTPFLHQYVHKWAELDEDVCMRGGQRLGKGEREERWRGRGVWGGGGGRRVMISAGRSLNYFFSVCL